MGNDSFHVSNRKPQYGRKNHYNKDRYMYQKGGFSMQSVSDLFNKIPWSRVPEAIGTVGSLVNMGSRLQHYIHNNNKNNKFVPLNVQLALHEHQGSNPLVGKVGGIPILPSIDKLIRVPRPMYFTPHLPMSGQTVEAMKHAPGNRIKEIHDNLVKKEEDTKKRMHQMFGTTGRSSLLAPEF